MRHFALHLIGKWKLILFAFIYTVSCTFFVSYIYDQTKKSIDEEINTRLYSGALMAVAILGDHFHDHLVDKFSRTKEQDWQNIQSLTHFSHKLKLAHIYTVIERNGMPVLTSSSASEKELESNKYVRFFDSYRDASPELLQALHEKRVIITNYTDRWGDFRAVFVPVSSADGTAYIAGAEVSLADYYSHLHGQILHLAGFSIFLFIDFSIFLVIYISYSIYLSYSRSRAAVLEAQQESAEAANQAKSRFVAVMSHELRTPLNGVIGATELLTGTQLNSAQQEYLHVIHSGSKSLLSIVNELLDLSKIEAGQESLEADNFALEPFLQLILSQIQPQLSSPDIQLTYHLSEHVPGFIRADEDKLRRILLNLCSNAAKYTEQGQIHVEIVAELTKNEEQLKLGFRIQDTGIGMSSEEVEQLFQPFTRIRSYHQKKQIQGTGLGLTISRHLVQMMGGDITVESRSGVGSLFSFDVYVQSVDFLARQISGDCHDTFSAAQAPQLRALVVDDSEVNQYVARKMLEKAGHLAETSGDCDEVLQLVQMKAYDVILMDINIDGEMTGTDLTNRIRQMPNISQPYISAYTANAYAQDIRKYYESGMDDVLIKPIQLKSLRELLLRVQKSSEDKDSVAADNF
ncbi:ATP-binding protein [Vibrio quintilis]|nr:ATP-binding protein [Vibrio quintilis]